MAAYSRGRLGRPYWKFRVTELLVNTIETSYTLKGKPTAVNRRVVSADGKTLTVTSTGTSAQGQKVNSVGVEKG